MSDIEHVDTDDQALEYAFDDVVPSDLDGFDPEDALLFLGRLADGWGEHEAGLAKPLGWTPYKIRQFLALDGMRELIFAIHEMDNESVERACRNTAKAGNPAAQKLWLMNKAQHRGWADRKSVRVEGEIDHSVVVSVREALEQQTREIIEAQATGGVAALQEAIGLSLDEDIIDAEVVDQ